MERIPRRHAVRRPQQLRHQRRPEEPASTKFALILTGGRPRGGTGVISAAARRLPRKNVSAGPDPLLVRQVAAGG